MVWRVANGLKQLFLQVNKKYPNRSKASDGGIGDANHASRSSDHNPWVKDGNTGIVTAIDITHDPKNGCDSYVLAQTLLDSRDSRIKYIISNGRIASGILGPQPWKWRKYTGKNPHNHHVHISIRQEKSYYDDTADWRIGVMPKAETVQKSDEAKKYVAPPPTIKRGSSGPLVKELQVFLNANGEKLEEDSDFGKETERALKRFQTKAKIGVDGKCGPQVWDLVRKVK